MTFGRVSVKGRRRVPSPAASIAAFNVMEPIGDLAGDYNSLLQGRARWN
jgi:hypothetical protein